MRGKSSIKDVSFYKNRILAFLINNSNEYSAKEIAELFDFSVRSIQNFIAVYNKKGYEIRSIDGKYVVLKLPDNFRIIKEKISNEEAKKLELKRAIFEASSNKKAINKKMFINTYTAVCPFTNDENYINKLIFQIVNDGYVRVIDDNVELVDDALDDLSEDEVLKLLIYINVLKNVYPKGKNLHEIYTKLILKYRKFNKSFNGQCVNYLQKNKLSLYEEFLLDKIEKAIINNSKIFIKYKTKKVVIKKIIYPSLLIYNSAKDLWYIVDQSNGDEIYRLDKMIVVNIVKTNKDTLFHINKKPYEYGIGISNEPIEKIEIYFEKKDYVYNKLVKYLSMRKSAYIKEDENKYILFDETSGILELEKWLFKFSIAIVDIKPEKLKMKILEDLKLLTERYSANG